MDRVKTNAEPKWVFLIIKNWPNPASFCFFRSFHMTWSKRRCVLWTRTRSNRMVGANQSTELWRHPYKRVLIQPKEETEIEFIWSVLWYKQTDRQTITRKDWSSGYRKRLTSKGCGFESWHHILDGNFSHIFVVNIVLFVWKDWK